MAKYTVRSGVNNHPEKTFLQLYTNLVRNGGVVSVDNDHYLVEEPDGGGLNVDVNTGEGYVRLSGSSAYPIRNTDTETVSVSANNSGNPRVDAVVAYVDLNETPVDDGEGTGIHKLAVIAGTPAGSPAAPDDGAIQTAVGAGNPWTKLAEVDVANGASGISNANITDTRRLVYFKSYAPLLTVAYTSTYAHNYSLTSQWQMVLTGNLTLNAPTNMELGEWMVVRLVQDATGGRSLTLGAGMNAKSPDMTLASSANQTSTYGVQKVGSASFDVFSIGKNY